MNYSASVDSPLVTTLSLYVLHGLSYKQFIISSGGLQDNGCGCLASFINALSFSPTDLVKPNDWRPLLTGVFRRQRC